MLLMWNDEVGNPNMRCAPFASSWLLLVLRLLQVLIRVGRYLVQVVDSVGDKRRERRHKLRWGMVREVLRREMRARRWRPVRVSNWWWFYTMKVWSWKRRVMKRCLRCHAMEGRMTRSDTSIDRCLFCWQAVSYRRRRGRRCGGRRPRLLTLSTRQHRRRHRMWHRRHQRWHETRELKQMKFTIQSARDEK